MPRSMIGIGLCAASLTGCDPAERATPNTSGAVRWSLSPDPVVSIGKIEGESGYLLTDVKYGTILSDGRIAISDAGSREIRVFTSQGGVAWIAGGSGSGPGEFRDISWVRELSNGHIAAYDWRGLRVSEFDAHGTHVSTRPLDFSAAGGPAPVRGLFDNGAVLLLERETRTSTAEPRPPFEAYRVPITHVLLTQGAADTVHVSPGAEHYAVSEGRGIGFGDVPLGAQEVFAIADTFAVTALGTVPVITTMTETGAADSIALPLPERPYSPDVQDRFRQHFLAGMDGTDRKVAERVLAESPVPEFLPFFDRIRIDNGERFWVREYDFESSLRTWFVFGTDGGIVARIAIPDSIQVLDVREGVLLGRTEDDLDVQRVHLWRIER